MPPGRRQVITHLAREGNEQKVYERVRRELEAGHQAYFVYPLIGESENVELKNAQRMFQELSTRVFPEFGCTLLHSRLPEEEKQARMRGFVSGGTRVLAATSVVEVGVDVPNATCMVVEHAERFGLSALHQLRGRVGRGASQSYAYLVYSAKLTPAGVQRLRIMKQTTDGFRIAEEDLRLRGPGALLGVEQSGYLRLGMADLTADTELLMQSREAVCAVLAADPELQDPENRALRSVLERSGPLPGAEG